MTTYGTIGDARRGERRNRKTLKEILGDKTWKSKTSTEHPGRTTYTRNGRTVVVGREGRVRRDTRTDADTKPGLRNDVIKDGGPGSGGSGMSDRNRGGFRPKSPPRKGSEGRKWGAFVNTETDSPRSGQRFNVVTRKGQQYNVYADGTAIKNTTGTKGYARGKGYRDVNENTGRSGSAGGGRQEWHKTTLGTTSSVPQTPAQKSADLTRDADWDKRIKAAREARKKRQANAS